MSAYGDYKMGLIEDSEYTRQCNEEYLRSLYDADDDDEDEEVTEDDFDELELF